jgi:5-methylthioadenosine/S-adenosylhomocysteine deaminase
MTDTQITCDLIIEAGWVVPIQPHGVVFEHHAVVVSGAVIIDIISIADARKKYHAKKTVSRPQAVLMPGMVNAHTHNPMTLMRGVADDLALMPWLQDHIWPIEAAVMGPEFVSDGVSLAIAEMLRGGTTCTNDNYFFPDAQAATYRQHGFRAMVGLPVIDFPSAWAKSHAEYFDRAVEVHDNYRNDDLIRTAFAPHAPYTVCDANFEQIRMLSDQLDIPVHCHTHETAQEVHDSIKQYGMRPIARLDQLGLWNDRMIAVHMTQLSEQEIALCAERGVSVVHCPQSNMKLASGFAPVEKLRVAGVNLALATDGCASNNDLDMFDEMRTAALLAKVVAGDATALNAASALHMATLGSAKAMGMGDVIGSLEIGKQADLICIDMHALETQPMYHVISQLVYASGRHQVSDVWIAGKEKLSNRHLVDIDVDKIMQQTHYWRDRIGAIQSGKAGA